MHRLTSVISSLVGKFAQVALTSLKYGASLVAPLLLMYLQRGSALARTPLFLPLVLCLACVWMGGLICGLLATTASAILFDVIMLRPSGELSWEGPISLSSVYFWLTTCAMVIMLHTLKQNAHRQQKFLAVSQAHMERSSRLQTLTAILGMVSELDIIAAIVVREGCLLLDSQAAMMVRLSDTGDPIVDSFWGLSYPAISALSSQLMGDTVTVEAMRAGMPPLWLTGTGHTVAPAVSHWQHATFAKGIAVLPLSTKHRSFGALFFAFAAPPQFSQSDRDRALTVAGVCAQALERVRLLAQSRRSHALLEDEHRWLEQILNVVPSPILIIEATTGKIIFVNQAATKLSISRMLGGPSEAPLHGAQGSLHDAHGLALTPAQMPYVRITQGASLADEDVQWHSDKTITHFRVTSVQIPASKGHCATAIIYIQDLSRFHTASPLCGKCGQRAD